MPGSAQKKPLKAGDPLALFQGAIAEVVGASKRRAFILDTQGVVRFAEDGVERPPPVTITMPGAAMSAADPLEHRKMDEAEAAHRRASLAEVSRLAKTEGPASERAMFWKGAGVAYHDLARHGRYVIWRYGRNNGFNEKVRVCQAGDEDAAAAFLADIRAAPPKGYRATSPYYVEGRGCVVRTYSKGDKRELLGVVGRSWRIFGGAVKKSFASAREAEREFDLLEHHRYVRGWGMFGIEIDRRSLRPADLAARRR